MAWVEPNVKQYGGMAGSAGESDAVWLLQPDGIFAQVLHDVAGAGCGSNTCTHVYDVFPHPQKYRKKPHVFTIGCYSRRRLSPTLRAWTGCLLEGPTAATR